MLTARFQVWESPTGLTLWGVIGRKEVPWREAFQSLSSHWYGVAAREILKTYLNENSMDDLDIVLEQYPDHVVELTALDRCFGTVPHRNAVVWEVRSY